jgi:hypothetical protein
MAKAHAVVTGPDIVMNIDINPHHRACTCDQPAISTQMSGDIRETPVTCRHW